VTEFTTTGRFIFIISILTSTGRWVDSVSITSHTVSRSFSTGHTVTVTFKDSSRSDWNIFNINGVDTLWNNRAKWWWVSFWTRFRTNNTIVSRFSTRFTEF
jgi:hypothetical protein